MGSISKAVKNIITGGDSGEGEYQQSVKDITDRIDREWSLPDYDKTPLTPQEFSVLTQYAPQIAAFVQQKAPQFLSKVNTEAVQAQKQSLQQLGQLSRTGMDEGMRAQLEEAQMSADQALRSNRANALAALGARGLGTSGATLGADIAAGLGAAEQQRMAALEAANQAAQRKVNAIQGLGSLGSQIAGQEQQMNEFNANTENQYDQLIANRRQQYQDYVAQTQNEANRYNQQQNQQIANMNTGLRNQYGMYNREREDRNIAALNDAKNRKLQLTAGLQSGAASQKYAAQQQELANSTGMLMSAIGIGAGAAMGGPSGAAMGGMAASQFKPNAGAPQFRNEYGGRDLDWENNTGGGYVADYGPSANPYMA